MDIFGFDEQLYRMRLSFDQIDRWNGAEYDKLAEYTYNGLGQRTGYTRYDTATSNVVVHTQYDYLDDIGWLQKVENREQVGSPGSNVISAYQYYDSTEGDKHDLVGNREYMKYNSMDCIEYEYDDLYRLTSETRKPNGTQSAKYEFTYDQAGNRTKQSRYLGSATWEKYIEYTYNNANQLTYEDQYTDNNKGTQTKETQYVYDNLGNLTGKNIETSDFTTSDYNDEIWIYEQDAYNRVTNVKKIRTMSDNIRLIF